MGTRKEMKFQLMKNMPREHFKVKQSICKGYILLSFNLKASWNRQVMGDSGKTRDCSWGRLSMWSTENFLEQ